MADSDVINKPAWYVRYFGNPDKTIQNKTTEITGLTKEVAAQRLQTLNSSDFYTVGQLEALFAKAGPDFHFNGVQPVIQLFELLNQSSYKLNEAEWLMIFGRMKNLSTTDFVILFESFPELVHQLPLAKIYEDLFPLSLWWCEKAYPGGLEIQIHQSFTGSTLLSLDDRRQFVTSNDYEANIRGERDTIIKLEDGEYNADGVKIADGYDDLLAKRNNASWFENVEKIKDDIKINRQNLIAARMRIIAICRNNGVGLIALDNFLRFRSDAENIIPGDPKAEKRQAWENFRALKAIYPKYTCGANTRDQNTETLLDERHIESLLALADTPEEFSEIIAYLCLSEKTQAALIIYISRILKAEAAGSENPIVIKALENVKRHIANDVLMEEENRADTSEDDDDDLDYEVTPKVVLKKGRCILSYCPNLTEIIYLHDPAKFARAFLKIKNPGRRLNFLECNQGWLTAAHLIHISALLNKPEHYDPDERENFFQHPFVRKKLRDEIDAMIIGDRRKDPNEDKKLLVIALKQRDLREAVDLTRKRGATVGTTNYVGTWLYNTRDETDRNYTYNSEVAQIVASDTKLLEAIRDPKDKRFPNNHKSKSIYLEAAEIVQDKIKAKKGWIFGNGKKEFVQWFIAVKENKVKVVLSLSPEIMDAISLIIAEDPELYQCFKDAYIGKGWFFGLIVTKHQREAMDAKRQELMAEVPSFGLHIKRQLEREKAIDEYKVVGAKPKQSSAQRAVEQDVGLVAKSNGKGKEVVQRNGGAFHAGLPADPAEARVSSSALAAAAAAASSAGGGHSQPVVTTTTTANVRNSQSSLPPALSSQSVTLVSSSSLSASALVSSGSHQQSALGAFHAMYDKPSGSSVAPTQALAQAPTHQALSASAALNVNNTGFLSDENSVASSGVAPLSARSSVDPTASSGSYVTAASLSRSVKESPRGIPVLAADGRRSPLSIDGSVSSTPATDKLLARLSTQASSDSMVTVASPRVDGNTISVAEFTIQLNKAMPQAIFDLVLNKNKEGTLALTDNQLRLIYANNRTLVQNRYKKPVDISGDALSSNSDDSASRLRALKSEMADKNAVLADDDELRRCWSMYVGLFEDNATDDDFERIFSLNHSTSDTWLARKPNTREFLIKKFKELDQDSILSRSMLFSDLAGDEKFIGDDITRIFKFFDVNGNASEDVKNALATAFVRNPNLPALLLLKSDDNVLKIISSNPAMFCSAFKITDMLFPNTKLIALFNTGNEDILKSIFSNARACQEIRTSLAKESFGDRHFDIVWESLLSIAASDQFAIELALQLLEFSKLNRELLARRLNAINFDDLLKKHTIIIVLLRDEILAQDVFISTAGNTSVITDRLMRLFSLNNPLITEALLILSVKNPPNKFSLNQFSDEQMRQIREKVNDFDRILEQARNAEHQRSGGNAKLVAEQQATELFSHLLRANAQDVEVYFARSPVNHPWHNQPARLMTLLKINPNFARYVLSNDKCRQEIKLSIEHFYFVYREFSRKFSETNNDIVIFIQDWPDQLFLINGFIQAVEAGYIDIINLYLDDKLINSLLSANGRALILDNMSPAKFNALSWTRLSVCKTTTDLVMRKIFGRSQDNAAEAPRARKSHFGLFKQKDASSTSVNLERESNKTVKQEDISTITQTLTRLKAKNITRQRSEGDIETIRLNYKALLKNLHELLDVADAGEKEKLNKSIKKYCERFYSFCKKYQGNNDNMFSISLARDNPSPEALYEILKYLRSKDMPIEIDERFLEDMLKSTLLIEFLSPQQLLTAVNSNHNLAMFCLTHQYVLDVLGKPRYQDALRAIQGVAGVVDTSASVAMTQSSDLPGIAALLHRPGSPVASPRGANAAATVAAAAAASSPASSASASSYSLGRK